MLSLTLEAKLIQHWAMPMGIQYYINSKSSSYGQPNKRMVIILEKFGSADIFISSWAEYEIWLDQEGKKYLSNPRLWTVT